MTIEELAGKVENYWQTFRRHKHLGQALDQSEVLDSTTTTGGSPSISPSVSPSASPSSSIAGRMYLTGSTPSIGSAEVQIPVNSANFEEGVTANTAGNRFVVITAGIYHIHGQVTIDVGGTQLLVRIYINGTPQTYSIHHVTGNTSSGETSLLYELNVDDFVELYASSTGSITTMNQGSNFTYLEIFKVA